MPHPARATETRSALPRHQRPSAVREFLFGVAYYPEQWPRASWRRDFSRMREAGVKVLRMGEFAWDVWEPVEGHYDFRLFDAVLLLAADYDMKVVLGTPTAGAPRWLSRNHPDWLRWNEQGTVIGHNSRQQLGLVAPEAREHCRRLVEALGKHYAAHPQVIGWQLDNEQHCVCALDFSPRAETAFQSWLKERYGGISRLNRAWGTAFSAQSYRAFEDVPLPLCNRPTDFPPHPSHLLDFYRFTSDVTVGFLSEHAAILKKQNSEWLVFHNGLFSHLDYWRLSEHLDVLGVDIYPGFGGVNGTASGNWTAYKLEECRAHSGTFIVPELASGAAGLPKRFLENPEPGQMRLWAWQCVAHGADGILHFRWRTCRSGWEIYWHGVLDHDDRPRRRLRELARESAEFQRVGEQLVGAMREVKIGLLIDFEQDDSHETTLGSFPSPKTQAENLLGAMLDRQLSAGLVHAHDSFAGLETLIVPTFGFLGPTLVEKLEQFVHAGGHLVMSARTGVRDVHNKALAQPRPGLLSRLLRCTVEEFGGFREPLLDVVPDDGEQFPGGMGYEIIRPRGAEVIARWAMMKGSDAGRKPHPAVGQPAATRVKTGEGSASLLGMWIEDGNVGPLCDWLVRMFGWQRDAEAGRGVEVTRRIKGRKAFCFVLNHTACEQVVRGVRAGVDLLSGKPIAAEVTLPAYGVAVIAERAKASRNQS